MLGATTLRGSSLLLNLAIVDEEPLWDMLPVNLYIFIYLFVCLFIYLCIYLFILSPRNCTITMHGPKFDIIFKDLPKNYSKRKKILFQLFPGLI